MSRLYKSSLIFGGLSLSAMLAYGQEAAADSVTADDVLAVFLFTLVALSLVALLLVFTMFILVRSNQREKALERAEELKAQGKEVPVLGPPVLSWAWFKDKLTDNVAIEEEGSIDLGHDYDGIRELDNNLPPWWKYGFYLTIVYAVLYWFVFHESSADMYEQEMELAAIEKAEYQESQANSVDENTIVMLDDGVSLAGGKATFDMLCAVCHKPDGGGTIGPNLTDEYWLHGGDIKDVFTTIKYGVEGKNMIAWADQLSPKEMAEVASYVMTLRGTNPPDAKAPEGELYVPKTEDAAPADSTAAEPAGDEVASIE
jgi:cytochrome c oxidase cbb3-type subunit 3